MKKILLITLVTYVCSSCSILKEKWSQKQYSISSAIDLVNIEDDKIKVTLTPAIITKDDAIFYIPETVPGTYSDDDYGKFVDTLYAFSRNRTPLEVIRETPNSWRIPESTKLGYLQYEVNDTFDVENTHEIFSPAGTNFKKDEQYLLNLHGVLGYFENQEELPFYIDIHRPKKIQATTSLPIYKDSLYLQYPFESSINDTIDTFRGNRYFEIIDNPIMYNSANEAKFQLDDISINLSIYSPNGIVKAEDLQPNIERMMRAQKDYLGKFNTTEQYTILLYLSDGSLTDAQSFGALEHHTSTVTVLPEMMPLEQMNSVLLDVISHEFFHIVTPLNLHSTQIHKFKYNDPEMSKHLWMYEGVTEYFAQHFQVTQELITPAAFYESMLRKIQFSSFYDEGMSFTVMSKNILEEPYASNYGNVYEKGALIGMCLDILIRETTRGEKGLLDVMKELTYLYGPNRPFEDDLLIPQIVRLTNAEIGKFFEDHVIGTVPIQYNDFFQSVGLEYNAQLVDTGFFLNGKNPFINANENGEIYILPIQLNTFLEDLGVLGNDIIKSINNKPYTFDNAAELINDSNTWTQGDTITIAIQRENKDITLTGDVTQPQILQTSLIEIDSNEEAVELRKQWLNRQ